MRRPLLSIPEILKWADEVRKRTGDWPLRTSGRIPGTDEVWVNIDAALTRGWRGLQGGSSLAKLLAVHRNRRNQQGLAPLTEGQIVKWADTWRRKTGKYPNSNSGSIPGVNGETWARVDAALINGHRGLPGGSSLARLLAEYRNVRNIQRLPELTIAQILEWADGYHRRKGTWPNEDSGAIPEAPGQTWKGVDSALRKGVRGLPGGSSLARLLAARRGVRNNRAVPRLTENGIWASIVSFHCRTRSWPNSRSGPVLGSRGEKWSGFDAALRGGTRGLPGGSSLGDLIMRKLQEGAPQDGEVA